MKRILVEGLAGLLSILAVGWYMHHSGYTAGYARSQAEYAVAAKAAQDKADAVTTKLQDNANQLETDRDKARTDLDSYRTAHPVGVVRVCHQASPGSSVPQSAGTGAAGAEASPVLQPEPSADIGPALEGKAGEADGINELYRMCRAAYLAVSQ